MTEHHAIPEFTIRGTTVDDVPRILTFIRELATYEKLADEVVATEELLREHLFGPRPAAEVVFGELAGQPVAFALYFRYFSTFLGRPGIYLEDLYVDPALRGRGIGTAMLEYLAFLAREEGCGRLEWWVLDWNEPARSFYRSIGAESMDDWTVHRVSGEELTRLARRFDPASLVREAPDAPRGERR
jgi:GNAT superfamily N-acetyltransferase